MRRVRARAFNPVTDSGRFEPGPDLTCLQRRLKFTPQKLFQPDCSLRKLELDYNFIKVRAESRCHDDGLHCETVKTSRLIHLLISSGKKAKPGEKSDSNYLEPQDAKETVIIKSDQYHRHLFDKLERIMDGKNFMALNGIGLLFLVLDDKANKHMVKALPTEDMKVSTDTRVVKSHCLVNLNAET
ncbi:hypothetical protein SAY87_024844 [Trapa incisa]|uniref:Uncharacterized protein n=1 Tax=Trapa incisa TaxID=236973 RepID=A0AAN7GDJ3_9MYRT|nr:hypothetical protein SAY87_024844 [Trapa incisa]